MNAHDSASFTACFVPDAVVEDEGRLYRGVAEIQRWIEAAFQNYRPTLQVSEAVSTEKSVVISGLVAGTFDGSPLVLHYFLAMAGDKIATLRCSA